MHFVYIYIYIYISPRDKAEPLYLCNNLYYHYLYLNNSFPGVLLGPMKITNNVASYTFHNTAIYFIYYFHINSYVKQFH